MGGARKLPFIIELAPTRGLWTKSNSDLRNPNELESCSNWDFYNEYGSLTKVRGTTTKLNSVYTEGTTKAINNVNFYKYLDFAGRQRRHVLIGAGTTLQRVESDGTLTSLATGKKERTWLGAQFERYLLLTNQNPFLVGDGDRPVKYDGVEILPLGVNAPGTDGTVRDDFNDETAYTDLIDVTLTNESVVTLDGDSIKVVPGTAGTVSQFARTYSPAIDVGTVGDDQLDDVEDRVTLGVYLTQGDLSKLAQGAGYALAVRFESGATSYWDFYFHVGNFSEGWNFFSIDLSEEPGGANEGAKTGVVVETGGAFDNTNINKITYFIGTNNATDQPTLYFDTLKFLDRGTPRVAESGSTTTLIDFSSVTNWTINSTNDLTAGSTPGDEGPNDTGDGGYWIIDKNDATDNVVDIDRDDGQPLNLDLSGAVGGQALLDVYVPTPGNLDPEISLEIWLSVDSGGGGDFVSSAIYAYSQSQLTAGWNTLILNLSSPTLAQGGGVDLDDIDYVRFRFNFVTDATVEDDYRLDNFLVNSSTGGDLVGDYSYRVTFLNKGGTESNAGPISPTVTTTDLGGDIQLNSIPISSSSDVIARNIYRTAAGGTEHLFVGTIFDNVTTSFVDTIGDAALGVQTPPIAGNVLLDHSPPPDNISFITVWNRTAFGAGNPFEPNILYYTNIDAPDEWPVINSYRLDSRITGMFQSNRGLIVTTDTGWWWVIGANPDFVLDKISDEYGAVGPRAVGRMKNRGYAVDRDGFRFFDLDNPAKISEFIRDKYEDLPKPFIEEMFTGDSRRYNIFLQANPDATNANIDSIFTYNYTADAVENEGFWSTLEIPSGTGIIPTDFEEVEDEDGEWHLYMSSKDGMLYEIFAPNTHVWTHADGSTTNISSSFTTPYIRAADLIGDPDVKMGQGRVQIKFVELRIGGDLSNGSTWTVKIDAAQGSEEDTNIISTKTLTFNFDAGQSLKRIRPQDLPAWEHVRFTVSTSSTDNLIYRGARIWWFPYPGPFVY